MRSIDGAKRPVPLVAICVAVLTGCGGIAVPHRAESSPGSLEQTFRPPYPSGPPARPFNRIDDAILSGESSTLTVTFVGGPGYWQSNACSTDYEPWMAVDGDILRVAILPVDHPDQATLPPHGACASMGYGWTFHLVLPEPFTGSTVEDLAGGTLWVRDPPNLVMPRLLPDGWVFKLASDEPAAEPPLWVRVYAPAGATVEASNRGAGQLDLYQAFGAATQIGGGEERSEANVDGAPAVLNRDPGSGELLLQWVVGGDGVALVANEADISVDELLEIAGAVEQAT